MPRRALGAVCAAAIIAGMIGLAPVASAAPPANDSFADAAALTGATTTATGTTQGAGAEPGEPLPFAHDGASSVWWRWVAPTAVPVEVSLAGSSFDTVLAVYTGATVGSLTEIASDDDDAGGRQSALTFTPVAGATYYLQVNGYDSTESGTVALAVRSPQAAIWGTVTGPSQVGLAYVCVSAEDVLHQWTYSAETDGGGHYRIPYVRPGRYALHFSDCMNWGYRAEYYEDAAVVEDATPVTIVPGGATVVVDAQLAAELAPGRPTDVNGVAGDGYVSLSWSWPRDGSTVRATRIRYSTDDGATWPGVVDLPDGVASYTVPDLDNATGYVFEVAGVNNGGAGPYSAPSAPVTPDAAAVGASAPGAPVVRYLWNGNQSLTLGWKPPVLNGGRALQGYVVEYSADGGGHWTAVDVDAPAATEHTLHQLQNGTTYQVRIAARTSLGVGGYSDTMSLQPVAVMPGAPSGVTGTAGSGSVTLHWRAPADDGGAQPFAYGCATRPTAA